MYARCPSYTILFEIIIRNFRKGNVTCRTLAVLDNSDSGMWRHRF